MAENEQVQEGNMPLFPTFRWRMVGKNLPLYERHLRSLRNFGVSSPLQAWIRSRLEWTMDTQAYEHPDSIIEIAIKDDDNVDVSLLPQRPIPCPLCLQRALGWKESQGDECGDSFDFDYAGQSLLWIIDDGVLIPCGEARSACNTLLRDLAVTLRMSLGEAREIPSCAGDFEAFVVDDEFGILPCFEGAPSEQMARLLACFEKLWTAGK